MTQNIMMNDPQTQEDNPTHDKPNHLTGCEKQRENKYVMECSLTGHVIDFLSVNCYLLASLYTDDYERLTCEECVEMLLIG